MIQPVVKDYYKTLELPPSATPEQIKKSYRRLALLYHPDKNQDNTFTAAHFRELQEAYSVLSHPQRRKKYDEERWLSGQFNQARQRPVSAAGILDDARKLGRHLQSIDVHRMNHQALQDLLLFLLSDSHLGLLQVEADTAMRRGIAAQLLPSAAHLHHHLLQPVAERLLLLAEGDEALSEKIHNTLEQARQKAWQRKALPWVIVLITLFFCLLVFLAGR